MDGEDLEFEEVVIAKTIGLVFHGLDFVVDDFQLHFPKRPLSKLPA